jgi:pimeloyl-ACP methyl ester carboxylesterase
MDLNYHRDGEGDPLVLIHGIGSRWQMWEPVLERLAAERDVIAIDLPGFGASPRPPEGTPPGIESLTSLVSEFLDHLGLDRPHVAGNSLGGWVSLELAKLLRARSATGLSPAGFHNDREAVYQRALLRSAFAASPLIAPRADALMAPTLGRVLGMKPFFQRPERIPPADAAATWRGLHGATWFPETLGTITRERFSGGAQITVPVTIAWGEHDHLLLPRQARRAKRAIPHARVLTLTGCGHVPTYDDPEQVGRVLLEGSAVRAPAQPAVAGR